MEIIRICKSCICFFCGGVLSDKRWKQLLL